MTESSRCPNCGGDKLRAVQRGSGALEMILWFISVIPIILWLIDGSAAWFFWIAFLLPALGYSIWRFKSRYSLCSQCGRPADPSWKRTNSLAVAGLVLGLMFNIPLVAGLLALVFALRGKAKAESGATGDGAVSRIALGLACLNITIWLGLSVFVSVFSFLHRPPPFPG